MKKYLYRKDKPIPLYRGALVIVLTNSKKKLKNHLNDFGKGGIYAHSILSSYKGRQGFFLILNMHNKYRKIKHGIITHEAIHIAHFIADLRGIKPDHNNDEPITYLSEWITDQVYKFIKSKEMYKLIG